MTLNELLWLLFAFVVGYSIAWFWKRLGDLSIRWGVIGCFFIVPITLYMQFMASAMIQSNQNLILSLVFAGGYLLRMMMRDE